MPQLQSTLVISSILQYLKIQEDLIRESEVNEERIQEKQKVVKQEVSQFCYILCISAGQQHFSLKTYTEITAAARSATSVVAVRFQSPPVPIYLCL